MFDKIFYFIKMRTLLETNLVFVMLLLDRDIQSNIRPTAFPRFGVSGYSNILVDVRGNK